MLRSHLHRIVIPAALLLATCERGTLGPGTGGASGQLGGAGGIVISGTAGFGGGQNCAQVVVPAPMVKTDILILLAASSSMNNDMTNTSCSGGCGASSKWALATAAIVEVAGDTDDHVNWGLKLFPDADNVCGVNSNPVVDVGPFTHSFISNALAAHTAPDGGLLGGGNAPVRAAVEAGIRHLGGLTDPNRKLLLLLDDSQPDCMQGRSDTTDDDTLGAGLAVNDARIRGFPTIVVGLWAQGTAADAPLDNLAMAGDQARPAGPPFYYPASDATDLATTLQLLVKSAATCVFQLPPAPNDNVSASGIEVLVDGSRVPQDPTHVNGWDYTDNAPTAVQIYGGVCDTITANPAKNVSIDFLCLI